jgi:multisubunit Na+/H+ antiporter MnhC subunit
MISALVTITCAVAGALFVIGLSCLIARQNLLKMVIGLEFLGKGVSLLFVIGGFIAGDVGLSQAVVFTLIAIEAVVAGLALALVIRVEGVWKTLDSSRIFRLDHGDDK